MITKYLICIGVEVVQIQEFHDFEAFSHSIRGVESKMLSRNPKQRTWSINSVALGGIDLQLGRLGSGNIAQGQLRPDGYIFYAPLTSTAQYVVNGAVLEMNSFAILEPDCEFCVSTETEHEWLTASIPCEYLPQSRLNSLSRSCSVSSSNGLLASQFRNITEQIFRVAARHPGFESSLAAKRALAELVRICALIAGEQQPIESHPDGRPRYSRETIIRRSMELIESNRSQLQDWPDVKHLAINASVSERTLRESFKEFFNIGPCEYLQLRKLHEIHNVLRAAKPDESSVSEILLEHGEWAFGRFAARYKALFGNLPAETLRRP